MPGMRNDGDIGLVLSGGGAKGAFQAGVWKAMHELGLAERVKAISGTSVGAINAAAFATIHDPDEICRFWRERVEEVPTPNLRNLSVDSFRRAAENVLAGRAFPFHGLLDRRALEGLIRSLLPERWPGGAPYIVASSLECRGGILEELDPDSYRLHRFRIDEEPDHDRRILKILASAAIPWGFDPVEIDEKRFVDGGWDEKGGDNTPLRPILEDFPDIQTIVVVRCNSAEIDPAPLRARVPKSVRVFEVRPSASLPGVFGNLADFVPDASFVRELPLLGSIADSMERVACLLRIWSGTFAFDGDFARRYIAHGYADGMAALRHLRPKEKLNW